MLENIIEETIVPESIVEELPENQVFNISDYLGHWVSEYTYVLDILEIGGECYIWLDAARGAGDATKVYYTADVKLTAYGDGYTADFIDEAWGYEGSLFLTAELDKLRLTTKTESEGLSCTNLLFRKRYWKQHPQKQQK